MLPEVFAKPRQVKQTFWRGDHEKSAFIFGKATDQ
jgi:hypothetical protein